MNHQKSEAFFSFYRKKEKLPLKLRLFHLVFTDVNTSFVHAVNSPLFSEQQNRFNVGYADKKSLKPK